MASLVAGKSQVRLQASLVAGRYVHIAAFCELADFYTIKDHSAVTFFST